ncbi:thiol-activated cytolysin family protein [Desulfobulbus sp. AH-315-M07]|nr:thiol-activated cytolysin family protein [Desulfobulbus sp. AH-315-M07]
MALIALGLFAASCSGADEQTFSQTGEQKARIDAFVLGLGHLDTAPPSPKTAVDCSDACPLDGQEGELYCSYARHTETASFEEFVAFQPNSATLWPGVVVIGADAEHGLLTPVGVGLAPVTFSMSLENIAGSPVGTMDAPSLSAFREERNRILSSDVTGATAAALDFSISEIHSESQLSIEIGADVSWPGGADVSATFGFGSEQNRTKILVNFTQAYYTVDADTPLRPSDFFSADTTVDDLSAYAGDGSPPMYVQSITYGRRVIFSIEASRSAQEIHAALSASYQTAAEVGGELAIEHRTVLEEATIHAFVLGGSAEDASGIIDGYEGLKKYITSGANYSDDSPGAPIAYKLAYLDNAVTELSFTTEYAERNCYKNRATLTAEMVRIDHIGGDDWGSNLEIHGYVALRLPTADSPVEDCFTGGKQVVIWNLPNDEWVLLPEDGSYSPPSPIYETIEDVVVGPDSQLCIYAHFFEDDSLDFLFGTDDDFSWDNRLITFDMGWEGEHVLQTHGDGDRAIDVTLKLSMTQ